MLRADRTAAEWKNVACATRRRRRILLRRILFYVTERETAAEILLETRGYADAVVTITDESADVVVGMSVLSDAQCAQIEDIVARKTGIAAQNIVINPISR